MNSRPIIFVGSRYHMSDLAMAAEKQGREVLGILDYQYWGQQDTVDDIPVIGDERWLDEPVDNRTKHWRDHCDFFVATLNDGQQYQQHDESDRERLRYQRIQLLLRQNLSIGTLIDPDASIAKELGLKYCRADIGRGVYIAPTADLANRVTVGDFAVIERQVFIGHHVTIGRNAIILPTSKICAITVGDNACIGYGVNTIKSSRQDHYTIGEWSTVWSHSQITKNVPANKVLTHNGRILSKYRSLDWLETP